MPTTRSHRLIRLSAGLGLLLGGLAVISSVWAGEASSLLGNITTADRKLSYQGIFILRKADRMMSMQVSHAADEDGVRENLVSLNGESRRVIRNNDRVFTIYPEREYVIISENTHKSALHPALPENLDKLQAYYEIERLDDDRIANLDATVIRLHPRDPYRYGYQYWVDADTGVLLRCDMLDTTGSVIEQMMFTHLEYRDRLPASQFETPDISGLTSHHLGENRKATSGIDWQISKLPAGFMLTQSSVRNKQEGDSLHLVYSDGLASVSVFIEQGESSVHHLEGATSMGALNAYATRKDNVFITVMGEVPADTVETIAMSTQHVAADGE